MRPLQERLQDRFSTLAIDWPGFGQAPRPAVAWRPQHYRQFLRFLVQQVPTPFATVAAGHAAGYALLQASEAPRSLGRLCLLSPTWRGPLPTMSGKRSAIFDRLGEAVDLPVLGPVLYRLNVNGPVVRMMVRGHVYDDKTFFDARIEEKESVTEAPGACHASFRFVAGALDPFFGRQDFLETARSAGALSVIYAEGCPAKSRAEMEALGLLPEVETVVLPKGKLSFYEEYPEETAAALIKALEVGGRLSEATTT